MIGGQKPSLEELRHYGVRGMKWKRRTGALVENFAKAFPTIKPMPDPHGRIPYPGRRPGHIPGQVTDASQIKIPEGRRKHSAVIDAYLRGIKAKRLLGEQKAKDILERVGDAPMTAQDNRG